MTTKNITLLSCMSGNIAILKCILLAIYINLPAIEYTCSSLFLRRVSHILRIHWNSNESRNSINENKKKLCRQHVVNSIAGRLSCTRIDYFYSRQFFSTFLVHFPHLFLIFLSITHSRWSKIASRGTKSEVGDFKRTWLLVNVRRGVFPGIVRMS